MKQIILEEWSGSFFIPHRLVFDAVKVKLFMEFAEYHGVDGEVWIRCDEYCETHCIPLFKEN